MTAAVVSNSAPVVVDTSSKTGSNDFSGAGSLDCTISWTNVRGPSSSGDTRGGWGGGGKKGTCRYVAQVSRLEMQDRWDPERTCTVQTKL